VTAFPSPTLMAARNAPTDRMAIDAAWNAVATRDAAFDGRFVYAVVTTGVFCRPSCPSRRPRRANARFFNSAAAAAHAGYRACRRCRPDEPADTGDPRVAAALALVERHLQAGDPPRLTLGVIADRLGISAFHLHRILRHALGAPFAQYVRARRRERFKDALRGGHSVSQATFEAGFGSSSRVYEHAGAALGMTPGAYRRGGVGHELRYGIFQTVLGLMLVAGTAHGVCHVSFGSDARTLESALRSEFWQATIERDDSRIEPWAESIRHQLDGRATAIDLPLDVPGTPFQERVWTALRRIPFGEHRSYQELAITIGRPTAARAVARACASNRVAVIIPCHRVVRGTGALGGYRWGLDRKQKLLDIERSAAAETPDVGQT